MGLQKFKQIKGENKKMENTQVKVEVKDIDVTKESFMTAEEVKRQVLNALNDWSMFTLEDK